MFPYLNEFLDISVAVYILRLQILQTTTIDFFFEKKLQQLTYFVWTHNHSCLLQIVEKLVDIVTYIHQAIREFLGNHGMNISCMK